MTRADKIYKLSQYKIVKSRFDIVHDAYIEHKSKMTTINAQIITGMPMCRSNCDKMSSMYIRLEELRNKVNYLFLQKLQARANVAMLIEGSKDKYKAILWERYLLCKGWKEICKDLNISWTHSQRLHDEGLDGIEYNKY